MEFCLLPELFAIITIMLIIIIVLIFTIIIMAPHLIIYQIYFFIPTAFSQINFLFLISIIQKAVIKVNPFFTYFLLYSIIKKIIQHLRVFITITKHPFINPKINYFASLMVLSIKLKFRKIDYSIIIFKLLTINLLILKFYSSLRYLLSFIIN